MHVPLTMSQIMIWPSCPALSRIRLSTGLCSSTNTSYPCPCRQHGSVLNIHSVQTTESALAAANDIHRQLPTHMADIRRDWLTNQNMDWCFVEIGLGRTSHSPLQQLKIDPVRQLGRPYWLASSGGQRIFINIRGQYGIQKNIYIHPWFKRCI